MAKKPSVKISGIVILRVIIFLFIGFVLFSAWVNTAEYLTNSPLFEVKEVMIEKSIQFIDLRSLKDLKGTNIFKVDIQKLDRQIAQRYPYIADLRVVKQLPDKILILAKKREPLMQIYYRKKYLLLDTEGVALYYVLQPADLPLVSGLPVDHSGLFLGGRVPGSQLNTVVLILNSFKRSPVLKPWHIHAVAAGNPAKIDLTVGQNLHVILDVENIGHKIDLLGVLIASNRVNLSEVKYIDLRFKEPVIAGNTDNSKE